MNTLEAFRMGMLTQHNTPKVFDWDKAARLIKERKPEVAEAGLSEDWEYTGGPIFEDGKPVPKEETYTFLSSTWATPTLVLDGEEIECFILLPDMNQAWLTDGITNEAHVYWPQSALDILNN